MDCCFFRGKTRSFSFSNTLVEEPLITNDGTTTDEGSSSAEGGTGVHSSSSQFPTWMKDDEADCCMDCDKKFQLFNDRKHHCRRCRNIFCKQCSSNISKILFLSINEDVRVCNNCFKELPMENNYISEQRTLLYRGNTFKKYIMMGLSTKLVSLRLTQDDKSLVYDDESRSEPTIILLRDIENMKSTNEKSFEITNISTSDDHLNKKIKYIFESSSREVTTAWIEALKVAIKRAREPPFRERIEYSRRQHAEGKKRAREGAERDEQKAREKDVRSAEKALLKEKYSLRGRKS